MCCFSRPVRHVSGTRIYARALEGGRQRLAYAATVSVDEEMAMVLPIPVPPHSAEDAVSFIDLSAAPKLLDELDALFVTELLLGFAPQPAAIPSRGAPLLVVHEVGSFDASFVPKLADFERLDPRFRIPAEVWALLPQYADWGFCVFKLRRPPTGFFGALFKAPPKPLHPMAFDFPRRDASYLFFPTVHIHAGKFYADAEFDHVLFGQPEIEAGVGPAGADADAGAEASARVARGARAAGWEHSELTTDALSSNARAFTGTGAKVFRKYLKGRLPNQDTALVTG